MVIAAFVLCAAVPVLADVFALTFTNQQDLAAAVAVGALAALSLVPLDRLPSSRSPGTRSS